MLLNVIEFYNRLISQGMGQTAFSDILQVLQQVKEA
jgi:hypothetical protein